MAAARKRLRWVALVFIVAGVAFAILYPESAARAAALPLLAVFSLARMVAAYLLALVFAIAYGTTMALSKRAALVMLPLLDILQSVPILGFFPAALVFFVATFQGHPAGLELAVDFLIFTSMAWNMAFGVYESLTTIPQDLQDGARVFAVRDWLRFRRLVFPAMVPKLVYNSMLSWSNGWFFLVASEIFTAFGATYVRPGLGAFIADRGNAGDLPGIMVGIAVLAGVVVTLDALIWRPLSVWSERFRIETTGTGQPAPRVPRGHERLAWLPPPPPTPPRPGVGRLPRVDDPRRRLHRPDPSNLPLPHSGDRGVRLHPRHGPAPPDPRIRNRGHAVPRRGGGTRGVPHRPIRDAVVHPVQRDRGRACHPRGPRGGGAGLRAPRAHVLETGDPPRDRALRPHREHYGVGRGVERPHRLRVHPIRRTVLPGAGNRSDDGHRDVWRPRDGNPAR